MGAIDARENDNSVTLHGYHVVNALETLQFNSLVPKAKEKNDSISKRMKDKQQAWSEKKKSFLTDEELAILQHQKIQDALQKNKSRQASSSNSVSPSRTTSTS